MKVMANGLLLAAVADGAGSAARAEEGSAIAVQSAMTFLDNTIGQLSTYTEALMQEAVASAFDIAWQAIRAHADAEQAPIAQFHSTLICVVADEQRVIVGHIGDGVVVVEDNGGSLVTIALPEHGEYANFTYFLTEMPSQPERFHLQTHHCHVSSLAISTDGLLEVAFSEPYGSCIPWDGFFQPLFKQIRSQIDAPDLAAKLARFLQTPKIRDRTGDDVTLAIAVRLSDDQLDLQTVPASPVSEEVSPEQVSVSDTTSDCADDATARNH